MKKNKIFKNQAFSLIELSIVLIIIGLVITGVIGGNSLIKSARIARARQLSKNFISSWGNVVPRPTMWFESSDKKYVNLDDNNKVERLIDRSGNGHHAVQITENNRPLYKEDEFNSLPALDFNGTSNYLSYSNIGGSYENTIIAVIEDDSFANFCHIMGSDKYNIGAIHFAITTNKKLGYSVNSNGGWTFFSNSNLSLNKKYIVILDMNEIDINYYINTSNDGNQNNNNVNILSLGPGAIGAWSNNAGLVERFFDGQIAEIIVFDEALTTEGREYVEDYLGKKWGIKLN